VHLHGTFRKIRFSAVWFALAACREARRGRGRV